MGGVRGAGERGAEREETLQHHGDARLHCAPAICKYDSALEGRINVTH